MMPADHFLATQHRIRHRFTRHLQLCAQPLSWGTFGPCLAPSWAASLKQSAEDEVTDARAVFCWVMSWNRAARGQENSQASKMQGRTWASPRWDEPSLLRSTKQTDQYVKEKEGIKRVITKKHYFAPFLFKCHSQSRGAHIFSIFVQEIAWPDSFCLQCVYCLKIQPQTLGRH